MSEMFFSDLDNLICIIICVLKMSLYVVVDDSIYRNC